MNPEVAQWMVDLGNRSSSACHWSGLTEALGRLVTHNSQGVHGRVVLARLNELDGIVYDLRVALCGNDQEIGPRLGDEQQVKRKARSNLLWSHLKPEFAFSQGSKSDHFREVDQQLLGQAIERYMRSPWLANDVLEWMMVDALVYQDVVSFGETIKRDVKGLKETLHAPHASHRARRVALHAVGVCGELSAFVAGPVVVAALTPLFISSRLVLWIPPAALACVVIYANVAILRALRRKSRKKLISKSLAKWSAMSAAYRSLEGPLVSIGQVRHELKKAAARGANWSAQTFALLAYAEARGVRTWKL
jgi:hypothetical protein